MISIVTPSFGQLNWLRLCVASVADQVGEKRNETGKLKPANQTLEVGSQISDLKPETFQSRGFDLEHIIQDGGTPGIEDFANEVGAEFYRDGKLVFRSRPSTFAPRLYRLAIYSEADAGMYDAINKGTSRMSGDVWAWLNSDEQYLPGTLAFVWKWFDAHPSVEILCGDALLTDSHGQALSYRRIVAPQWHHTRLVHLSSLSCASFYRRSVVDRFRGFDTSWRSIGDAEWFARMLKSGVRIRACGKLLSTFAFTGQNTSESPLALKESQKWKNSADAPLPWMRRPVIWLHRIRKLLAGAYRRRDVCYGIYRGGIEREFFRVKGIGWSWPAGVKAKETNTPPARQHRQPRIPYADTTKVLGTSLMETSYDELSAMLLGHVSAECDVVAVDFANTHIVTMRRHDCRFRDLTECIDRTVPDGMPLVWVMNAKGADLKDRVYGPTFTREFLAACPAGKTHYLVGGSEECGRKFRERMLALNPSLQFVGGYHGRCSTDGILDHDEMVRGEIREKKPDFIWVGLGTPKQYAWINRIKPRLDQGVLLAVGFAFDVNAGMKPDAPLWMQRSGLTWMYRLATEPKRLTGRYMKWNSLFLFYMGSEVLARHASNGARNFSKMLRRWKLIFRELGLKIVDLFASDIRDCETGNCLGRGLLIGWRGYPWVIGHAGLPPLIARFLPQKRLTYWRQSLGFTTHERPDFPRLAGVISPQDTSSRVMNVVLTHYGAGAIPRLLASWEKVCRPENLWIAFGGSSGDFDSIDYSRKVFINDPGLRKQDNQREKQSYTGIFRAIAPVIEHESPDYIYLCEYDHLPLVSDLSARQVAEITAEGADVMGHWLYRVDETCYNHMLYHQSDPAFMPYWQSISLREEKGVVLSMFGSGSLWSREAYLAIASREQSIDCYLELYLPTLAHHLGYRVRCWDESRHMISNLPSRKFTIDEATRRGCLTIHPVK